MRSILFLGAVLCMACTAAGQSLVDRLQGKWISSRDTTELLTVAGDHWTYSTVPGFDSINPVAYNAQVREWVNWSSDDPRLVRDEVILANTTDTVIVIIDHATKDRLFLSGDLYPKGNIYRRSQ